VTNPRRRRHAGVSQPEAVLFDSVELFTSALLCRSTSGSFDRTASNWAVTFPNNNSSQSSMRTDVDRNEYGHETSPR